MSGHRGRPGSTDWRALVRQKAAESANVLSESTVDELAEHLEDLYQAQRDAGVGGEQARAEALSALETSSLQALARRTASDPRRLVARDANDVARAVRDSRGGNVDVATTLRMALRQFRHHPGFALVTVVVMALGIAAATTIATVLEVVVLRPLPYRDPQRLVTIWDTNVAEGHLHDAISPVNFSDQRELPVFEDAAAWWRPGVNLVDPGLDPIRVNTIEVSGNLFELLGVVPQLGAGFPEKGPLFDRELVAVVSDRLWRSRYGADPGILGKQLSLNDTPYTVVGVMPAGFHFPDDVDVWERLRWDMTQHSRQARFMESVARLSPGTTLERAQSAVDALWMRLVEETAGQRNSTGEGWGSRLVPLLDEQLGYYRPALYVLFGAVGLLLVIGVLNVASLLLTRALSREREVALRIALGASPRQLLAQLITESLVLSLGGAILGFLATAVALPLIVRVSPVEIPRLAEARLGWTSLGVGLGIAAVTTLVFGLLPAFLLLRRQVTTDLKSGERGSSRGARRFYSFLVAGEVALAAALLTSSALLVRTVERMVNTPTGVAADPVLTTRVQLASNAYDDWEVVGATHSRILERIREQPGVLSAGATNFLPFGIGWRGPFAIRGAEPEGKVEDYPQAQMHSVSEGYFEAMGATLAEGRQFTSFDEPDTPGVVIVNESFRRQYLGGREAMGTHLSIYAGGVGPLGRNLLPGKTPYDMEIVGVVRDLRNAPLGQPVEPAFYLSTRQFPFREQFLAVRGADTAMARAAVRTALKDVAPDVPVATMETWKERLRERTAEPRLLMDVLLFFGAVAALLASLGVYGLFSWSVALRRRELAIRLTLGARPALVGSLVLRQSGILVAAGLVLGLVIVRLADRALSRVLFEVSPTDAASILSASLLLLVAALVACLPPVIRAMRVDPAEGLRTE